jgi:uridine phosphorylase
MSELPRSRSAADPWLGATPPHLPTPQCPLPTNVLLPGDPARVDVTLTLLDQPRLTGQRREFRLGTGHWRGVPVAVCSTGIGGPSTEIALVELARLGARSVVRVGGMGAWTPDLPVGAIGVVSEATRGGGAARWYSGQDTPAVPDSALQGALEDAARLSGRPVRRVRVESVDSYYLGQGRPVPGHEEAATRRTAEVLFAQVDGLDMESETVLAVGRALGLRSAALLGVHGNRVTDEWLEDYEPLQHDVVVAALDAVTGVQGT